MNKNFLNKCKNLFFIVINAIKNFIVKYKYIIFMILSFFILDYSLRYFTKSINFYNINNTAPTIPFS